MAPARRIQIVLLSAADAVGAWLGDDAARAARARELLAELAAARALRERGGARCTWLAGALAIAELLADGDAGTRAAVSEAIAAEDLRWNALALSLRSELLDADLIRHALAASARLSERFALPAPLAATLGAAGQSLGLVPALAAAGARLLLLPDRGAARAPACFRWRRGDDQVVVARGPLAAAIPLSPRDSLVCLLADPAWAHDPDLLAERIAAVARSARGAAHADGLEQWVDEVSARTDLPSSADELGDPGLAVAAGDPYLAARLRALVRLRAGWVAHGQQHEDAAAFARFSDGLLRAVEPLPPSEPPAPPGATWERSGLPIARRGAEVRALEARWNTRRARLDDAVAALPTELRREARAAVRDVLPDRFETRGLREIEPRVDLRLARFTIGFDHATGAIATLVRRADRRAWATKASPLALLRYQTFAAADYAAALAAPATDEGLTGVRPVASLWQARLDRGSWRSDADADRILLALSLPDEARKRYGAPERCELMITAPSDDDRIELDLRWFGKPASRVPEALWLGFAPAPAAADDAGWTLDKLGEPVSPLAVAPGGGRRLHAIGAAARWTGDSASFVLESLDAPLVAPGGPGLLAASDAQPACRRGMHVLLADTVDRTAGPLWYDEDARFRFVLRFG